MVDSVEADSSFPVPMAACPLNTVMVLESGGTVAAVSTLPQEPEPRRPAVGLCGPVKALSHLAGREFALETNGPVTLAPGSCERV